MRSEIFIKELLQHWKTKEPDLVAKGITTILELILEGSEWRDVKKEFPNKNDRYLCYDERQGLQMVVEWLYDFENKKWDWFTNKMHPTHWRICPEPPKFEEK